MMRALTMRRALLIACAAWLPATAVAQTAKGLNSYTPDPAVPSVTFDAIGSCSSLTCYLMPPKSLLRIKDPSICLFNEGDSNAGFMTTFTVDEKDNSMNTLVEAEAGIRPCRPEDLQQFQPQRQ